MEIYLIPVIVALLAASPGVYAIIAQRRKDDASAADQITETALQLIKPLKSQLNDHMMELQHMRLQIRAMNMELDSLYTMLDEIANGAKLLERQLEDSGHVPVYRVPPAERWQRKIKHDRK
jgi:septal ring factor EnvC (AmiA/AmiB activator)